MSGFDVAVQYYTYGCTTILSFNNHVFCFKPITQVYIQYIDICTHTYIYTHTEFFKRISLQFDVPATQTDALRKSNNLSAPLGDHLISEPSRITTPRALKSVPGSSHESESEWLVVITDNNPMTCSK